MAQSGIPTKWIKWIVGAFVLGLVLLAIPGFHSSRMVSNERYAASALNNIMVAQVDFRSNDLDGNGSNEFWMGDIAGLHDLEVNGKPLALIPVDVADADSAPLRPRAGGLRPYRGYLFAKLSAYLLEDGSKTMLGYVAYPAKYRSTGRDSFFVCESNVVFREDMKGKVGTEFMSRHFCDKYSNRPSCPMENCPKARESEERRRKWLEGLPSP